MPRKLHMLTGAVYESKGEGSVTFGIGEYVGDAIFISYDFGGSSKAVHGFGAGRLRQRRFQPQITEYRGSNQQAQEDKAAISYRGFHID